jgi:hypothetical protein
LQLHRSLVTFALENQNIIEHVQAQHNWTEFSEVKFVATSYVCQP